MTPVNNPFDMYKEGDDELVNFKNSLEWSKRGEHSTRVVAIPPDQVEAVAVAEEGASSDVADVVSDNQPGILPLPTGALVWGPHVPACPTLARAFVDLQMKFLDF